MTAGLDGLPAQRAWASRQSMVLEGVQHNISGAISLINDIESRMFGQVVILEDQFRTCYCR